MVLFWVSLSTLIVIWEEVNHTLNDEDMTTASRAALAAGIPRRDINEVEISKIVEEMLRKFLQEHALPILMQRLPQGEISSTQYPDMEVGTVHHTTGIINTVAAVSLLVSAGSTFEMVWSSLPNPIKG